jgi:hypothetical protein
MRALDAQAVATVGALLLERNMRLSDDVVTLRPWSREDAGFMAEACADPAIRRYNGVLDRLGRPAPPPSIVDAEAVIEGLSDSLCKRS